MDEDIKLMQKKVDDLTVGDALKINLGVMAICAAIPLAIVTASAARAKFADWRYERNLKHDSPEAE